MTGESTTPVPMTPDSMTPDSRAESEALLARARDCLGRNQLPETAALARQVLARHPQVVSALMLVGVAGVLGGQARDALPLLRLALSARPDEPALHHAVSMAFRDLGEAGKACDHADTATRLDPGNVKYLRNQAYCLYGAKRLDQAAAAYGALMARDALELRDLRDYARTLMDLGRPDEAEAPLRAALAIAPGDEDALFARAHLLTLQQHMTEALATYRQVVEINPRRFMAYVNLASIFIGGGNPQKAAEACRHGLAAGGQHVAGLHANYSLALSGMGKTAEAVAALERAVALDPLPKLASNLLFSSQYLDRPTEAVYDQHRDWNRRYARPLGAARPHGNAPDPGRRLRIGYVSPDLRGHSCAFFLWGLYRRHDRQRFEIVSYSCTDRPDSFTEYFQDRSDLWRTLNDLSDEAAAGMVRADGIDILIDLAGHSARNRMLMFARKPAPVQATWLGYPTTTGLDAIDWRITDDALTPPGSPERFTEQLYRLPRLSHCYTILPDVVPETTPGPLDSGAGVTFGSFNNFAKVSDATLRLWAAVINAAPGTRLRLKSRNMLHDEAHTSFLERFQAAGGDIARLDVTPGEQYTRNHLARYGDIDIALDTIPYGGMTTSCEALVMGVPVIALAGDRTASRYAASLLDAIGLGELVARTPEDYVAIAAGLAADHDRLRVLRRTLRDRMRASELCDEEGFARAMETAYRDMWGRWCATQSPGS